MRSMCLMLSLGLLATACSEGTGSPADTAETGLSGTGDTAAQPDVDADADNDGYPESVDCDDTDDSVHPDAQELCDGVDNDCDDAVDEDAEDGFEGFWDGDGDGHGDPALPITSCTSEGLVVLADDCDDARADVHPGAVEACDGVDNDCDEVIDEDMVMVPEDHATLQEAVDAAADEAEICVAAGTWNELVDVDGRALTLTGRGGVDGTTLDVAGLGDPMIKLRGAGANLTVQGFTVTGLVDGGAVGAARRGAFLQQDGQVFTGRNLAFVDNSWAIDDDMSLSLRGGLIHADGGRTVLQDAEIARNTWSIDDGGDYHTVTIEGGFLRSAGSNKLELVRVDVHDNTFTSDGDAFRTDVYGGLFAATGQELTVEDLLLQDNTVELTVDVLFDVEGLFLYGTPATDTLVEGLQLLRTTATIANDGVVANGGDLHGLVRLSGGTGETTVRDVLLQDNVLSMAGTGTLQVWGSLLRVDGGELVFDGAELFGNTVEIVDADYTQILRGGMLYVGGDFELSHLDVRANEARARSLWGGIVRVQADQALSSLHHASFAGNVAGSEDALSVIGGVLLADAHYDGMELSHLTLYGNEITSGDFLEGGALELGALWASSPQTLSHITATSNTATAEAPSGADIHASHTGALLSYNNVGDLGGVEAGETDMDVDPGFVDVTGDDPLLWDLHLLATSELVDAGDPDCADEDGTVCDIGAYGGPGGDW